MPVEINPGRTALLVMDLQNDITMRTAEAPVADSRRW